MHTRLLGFSNSLGARFKKGACPRKEWESKFMVNTYIKQTVVGSYNSLMISNLVKRPTANLYQLVRKRMMTKLTHVTLETL